MDSKLKGEKCKRPFRELVEDRLMEMYFCTSFGKTLLNLWRVFFYFLIGYLIFFFWSLQEALGKKESYVVRVIMCYYLLILYQQVPPLSLSGLAGSSSLCWGRKKVSRGWEWGDGRRRNTRRIAFTFLLCPLWTRPHGCTSSAGFGCLCPSAVGPDPALCQPPCPVAWDVMGTPCPPFG